MAASAIAVARTSSGHDKKEKREKRSSSTHDKIEKRDRKASSGHGKKEKRDKKSARGAAPPSPQAPHARAVI